MNDIHYQILKYGMYKNILKIKDLHTIQLVSKNFYFICKEIKRLWAYKITRKYLKNCKNKLLYMRYTCIQNPLQHKKKYIFNLSLNLDEIITDSILVNHPISPVYMNDKSKKPFRYQMYIRHIGDIISSFTIIGKNISKFELYCNGMIIFKQDFLNANMVNIIPFLKGFYIPDYTNVEIRIYAPEVNNVYCRYLFLKKSDSLLCKNDHYYNDIHYNDKKLYTTRQCSGMVGQSYVTH